MPEGDPVALWRYAFGRLCTHLHKLPSEVAVMEVDEAMDLFDFWNEHPEFLGLVRGDGSTSSPSRLATKADVKELLALQG